VHILYEHFFGTIMELSMGIFLKRPNLLIKIQFELLSWHYFTQSLSTCDYPKFTTFLIFSKITNDGACLLWKIRAFLSFQNSHDVSKVREERAFQLGVEDVVILSHQPSNNALANPCWDPKFLWCTDIAWWSGPESLLVLCKKGKGHNSIIPSSQFYPPFIDYFKL
jgi:hypothetical protein